MELKALFILGFLAVAQCKLLTLSCEDIRAFVDGHNNRRILLANGEVSGQPAASEMKMMVWDEELASKAAKWVSKNRNIHNPDRTIASGRFTTGENLYSYFTTNMKHELKPDTAIQAWFDENVNFTFGPLQTSDFDDSKSYEIGHYTQMVWSDSTYLGCAVSQNIRSGWNKFYVACNYGPGGNYLFEKPYKVTGGPSGELLCSVKECSHRYGKKCRYHT